MANDLTQNPLIFDTGGATSAYTGIGKINAIVWKGRGTAGDLASVRESETGRIIWQARAGAEDDVFTPAKGIPFTNLYVDDLDGGTLFIYLE